MSDEAAPEETEETISVYVYGQNEPVNVYYIKGSEERPINADADKAPVEIELVEKDGITYGVNPYGPKTYDEQIAAITYSTRRWSS